MCLLLSDALGTSPGVATCKDWSQQLRPILWTNFSPRKPVLETAALEANLHLIRTLRLQGYIECLDTLARGLSTSAAPTLIDAVTDSAGQYLASTSRCTNLRRIDIAFDSFEMDAPHGPHLCTLLRHNQSLTQLIVHVIAYEGKEVFFTQLMERVSALHRLQHLTISTGRMEGRMFLSMMRACLPLPRLSELYCDFALYFEDDADQDLFPSELETILKEAVVARSTHGIPGTRIKAFQPPCLRRYGGGSPISWGIQSLTTASNLLASDREADSIVADTVTRPHSPCTAVRCISSPVQREKKKMPRPVLHTSRSTPSVSSRLIDQCHPCSATSSCPLSFLLPVSSLRHHTFDLD